MSLLCLRPRLRLGLRNLLPAVAWIGITLVGGSVAWAAEPPAAGSAATATPAAKGAATKATTTKATATKTDTTKTDTTKASTAKAAKPKAGTTKAGAPVAAVAAADKTQPAAAPAAPAAAAPAPAGSSPMAELKKSNLALDKALSKNRPNWSPEAELQRAEVRKIVGSFLDYGELARRALARHWEPLTPKQREDFVATLRELVERSYLKQVHGNAAYNIKYEKEEKTGNDASVTAALNTTARGKKVVVGLEYKMLYKDGHWVVYDVLTDEQSMVENYRAEFNKIITKESFDALLKKMKKKLDEKEE